MSNSMRYISLFSGIEAASVAWSHLGWQPLAFSEIEPFCCAFLNKRFPSVPNLGDISKIDWTKYEGAADVVIGGSPCQAFSVAGKRGGMLDDRGMLMLEYVRAVRDIKPRWVVWENVPGVLSQDGGRAFATLLEKLEECGYSLAWRVLDAQFYRVAQRRRRVFLVGHPIAGCAAAVLFEHKSLRWDSPSSREKRQELAAYAEDCPGRRCWQIAGNIVGRGSSNGGNQLGVTDPDEHGAYTLTTADVHAVVHGSCAFGFAQNTRNELRIVGDGTVSGALAASPGMKQTTYVCQFDHRTIGFKYHQGSGAGSIGCQVECSPTLTADYHQPAVCMADSTARAAVDVDMCGTVKAQGGIPTVATGMAVRRLMPVECERLQGFPDGWTDLGGTADAPRYKAIGNSMAVPVILWLGEQIAKVEEVMGL